jgi:hypothetical protein
MNGVPVETDTPQEAVAMIAAANPAAESPRPRKNPQATRPVRSVPIEKPHRPGLFKADELSSPLTLNGMNLDFLAAMKEAYPNAVSSDQMVARIGGTRQSIPIIIVTLRKYAESKGLELEDLMLRGKAPKGEKGSTWSLTPKGMKEFF